MFAYFAVISFASQVNRQKSHSKVCGLPKEVFYRGICLVGVLVLFPGWCLMVICLSLRKSFEIMEAAHSWEELVSPVGIFLREPFLQWSLLML